MRRLSELCALPLAAALIVSSAACATILEVPLQDLGDGYFAANLQPFSQPSSGGDRFYFEIAFGGAELNNTISAGWNRSWILYTWDPEYGNSRPYAGQTYPYEPSCSAVAGCLEKAAHNVWRGSLPQLREERFDCNEDSPVGAWCASYYNGYYYVDLWLKGAQPGTSPWARITFSPPAIPEPATWAFLIAGFGVLGWPLRHRAALAASDA